jgi:Flp pilus assembly CpaF family ATPase
MATRLIDRSPESQTGGEPIRCRIRRLSVHQNRGPDLSSPFVDAVLPDCSRLHVVIPDII